MKTDNELIAEFMSIVYEVDPAVKSNKKYYHYNELMIMSSDLHFDTSWDWLMPVVEKISEYRLAHPDESDKVCNCKVVIGIQYLYPKVVDFIKYINTHQ